MRANSIGLALTTVAFAGVLAWSAEELPVGRKPVPAAEVTPLIELLGSKDYREREKAHKALTVFGDRVLPNLKAAMAKADSPEAQRRLEVMVARLEREQFLAPSRVSLKAKNQPFKAVLKDLCRQAGYELKNDPGLANRVTMEFENLPFWEAISKVCEPVNIRLDIVNEDKGEFHAYAQGEQISPYTSIQGPFRFTANNINSNRNRQLANIPRNAPANQDQEYMNLNGIIQGEPKCPIVGMGGAIVTKAVDDTGVDLIPTGQGELNTISFHPNNFYRGQTQGFNLNLARGSRDAKVIKELRGKVGVLLLTEARPEIVVEKLAEVKKGKFAGATIDLDSVEFTVAEGNVNLSATFRPRDITPNDYNWWNSVNQRMQVIDEFGQKWMMSTQEQSGNGVGLMSAKLIFTPTDPKKAGKPVRFQIVEWITVQQQVEFVFKNVPLP